MNAETSIAPSRPRTDVFSRLLAGAALLYGSAFFYFVGATIVRFPVYDVLEWVRLYLADEKTAGWLAYLWTPHNEHRIVFSRLLVAIDVDWFGGTGAPFILFGIVLTAGVAATILWQIANSELSDRVKMVSASVSIILLLPSSTAIFSSMPLLGMFVQTCSFALFAIALQDTAPNSQARLKMLASLLMAILATFAGSGGILLWPVVAYNAYRLGSPRWCLMISILGAGYIAVYSRHVPVHSGEMSLNRMALTVDYFMRFLGLPWSHAPATVWFGRLIGACILIAGSALAVRDLVWQKPASKLERIGIALILFGFLVALAAGYARWDVAPDREMPIRYVLFVALVHLGIFLASTSFLQRLWDNRSARKLAKVAIATTVSVLLLQQIVVGHAATVEAGRYNEAWKEFVRGEWTSEMEHYVYPDKSVAVSDLELLKRNHVYGQ